MYIRKISDYTPQLYPYKLGKNGKVTNEGQSTGNSGALYEFVFSEEEKAAMQAAKASSTESTEIPTSINGIQVASVDVGSSKISPDGGVSSTGVQIISRDYIENMVHLSNVPDWYTFEPTGDATDDRHIQMGLDYKESCFDFTNSSEYCQLTKSEDFTGMTNAEKYKAIYEKYQYCYGENFMDSLAVYYPEDDPYQKIIDRFNKEVETACGGSEEATQARIEALYGSDLSDYEVREKIIEKYKSDDTTYLDICKMANEMKNCGMNTGLRKNLDPVTAGAGSFYSAFSNIDSYDYRETMLGSTNVKKYLTILKDTYHGMVSNGISLHPDYGTTLGQVLSAFGMSL